MQERGAESFQSEFLAHIKASVGGKKRTLAVYIRLLYEINLKIISAVAFIAALRATAEAKI